VSDPSSDRVTDLTFCTTQPLYRNRLSPLRQSHPPWFARTFGLDLRI
jgi:hypothetical protein